MTGHPAAIVTWRKSSGQLPQARVGYNSRNQLQILNAQKDYSDTYFCSAVNLLGRVEKKTLLIVVSRPRFTVKPPAKVVVYAGDNLTLNCNATGDPKPIISWEMEGASLPAGRSQQIGGALVIREMNMEDTGKYVCVATALKNVKNMTHTEVKGKYYLIPTRDNLSMCKNLTPLKPHRALNFNCTQSLNTPLPYHVLFTKNCESHTCTKA